MPDVGYIRAQAWSTYFIETVYTHAYSVVGIPNAVVGAPTNHTNPKLFQKIQSVFTGSTLDTFRRMCISHAFQFCEHPTPGAIAFWQIGHTWLGQAGIVCKLLPDGRFLTIEAHNTTGEEDGFSLSIKPRKINTPHQPHGPNLQGFIIPHPQYV